MPRDPRMIYILPGKTVGDTVPQYSIGVNDVDVGS